MQDFLHKKIVLGICGGIAAYKSAYLVRELVRLGAEVRVVMTEAAHQFMTPMTMQALSGHEVRTDVFDSQAERAMGHIELARWADYLILAPLTAHTLAKCANGLADDLLSTLYLVAETPVFVCPAMNQSMWKHPATVKNCKILKERSVIFIGPEEGSQACGEFGFGRMSEPEQIIDALRLHEVHQLLKGKRVLLTAGPTREAIDPVRYISNRSSGKMGYALANALSMAGATVELVTGPTSIRPPVGMSVHQVESAMEMYSVVMNQLKPGTIFIGCAAVADFSIESPVDQKMKKKDSQNLAITLTPTPDILASVVKSGKASFVVGFAAETNDVLHHAKEKQHAKKADMIVANQVGKGRGFDSDMNQVTVLTKNGQIELAMNHKTRIAGQIVAILARSLQNDDICVNS